MAGSTPPTVEYLELLRSHRFIPLTVEEEDHVRDVVYGSATDEVQYADETKYDDASAGRNLVKRRGMLTRHPSHHPLV